MESVADKQNLTLDPGDWESFRGIAHRMVNDMVDHLSTVREKLVWQPIPEHVYTHLRQPLPRSPQSLEEIYDEFRRFVLPYGKGTYHPRFWGWVEGMGTPTGIMAEMLAATVNAPISGFQQSPVLVELQVLDWFKEIVGYPSSASGLLVSGGSAANLTALAVARNTKAATNVRTDGLGRIRRRLVLYASTEVHNSIVKSAELLGLGSGAIRAVRVDNKYSIDVGELEEMIRQDLVNDLQPFCIVGSAGTTNTGSVDDLWALGEIARRYALWFHVDGAIGAPACIAPTVKTLLRGIEYADSIAFDLHKWMHAPYQVGCVLIRDEELHRESFASEASYLARYRRGVTAGPIWFPDYGFELSRSFRALKVWMTLKEHGTDKIGELIEQNIDDARYLANQIRQSPELELLAPVVLSTVCFRYVGDARRKDDELNELNERLLVDLQESGLAVLSSTKLNGKFALRVSNTNHRTQRADFDVLVNALLRLAKSRASKI